MKPDGLSFPVRNGRIKHKNDLLKRKTTSKLTFRGEQDLLKFKETKENKYKNANTSSLIISG